MTRAEVLPFPIPDRDLSSWDPYVVQASQQKPDPSVMVRRHRWGPDPQGVARLAIELDLLPFLLQRRKPADASVTSWRLEVFSSDAGTSLGVWTADLHLSVELQNFKKADTPTAKP